ncbi:M23 family metallopeptidase [Clostridium botulinum]|uniref:M23 family metallopeptidase n=2 Tax=Clostridium botulinum TaxID=1491 RepID=A0A846I557_CLOBO|nr:M23 family metallopeptidase [Clostridium botulinum]ACQ54517.1 peptidase, family M23/M37 [Clostridium botulinum Ba4 str. 657]AJE11153.1 peptidase M23 family protein [Clostridium botulinum CDC_1436]AXG93401.1 M23 family peptidase [Clostridium botulinum]EDT87014.1 peptidase, M23/M37 family [Clostridium botulinum Bf]MBY6881300.1 M23 family metallopeptidase [Clostridium botulinum]
MYNSQYEEYYNSLKNRKTTNLKNNNYMYGGWNNRRENSNMKFFQKRIIRDLIGVFLLLISVLGLKAFSNSKTQMVYNYSKKIVNENYDYQKVINKAKNLDVNFLEDKILKYIDTFKSKVTGEKTIEELISNDFVLPVNGKITSTYGEREDPINKKKAFHKGIDIDAKENTEVLASFSGTVKECGEDKELGKYILLDHGQGIETRYAHLNKIKVKKGEEVKKGKAIGESGNTGKSTGAHLHFEIIYMGENKNPQDYFSNIKE